MVGSSDRGNPATGGIDFSTMSVGGTISGSVTINGDSSGFTNTNLYINAYSPSLGYNVSTQLMFSTNTLHTVANYQIGGVADGTYQMFAPYLPGFDPSSFGPQTVHVSGGAATVNFTLTQETGQIIGRVTLPNGQSDYGNVHLSLQGPSAGIEQDLSASSVTLTHLGTGFFNLRAIYRTTGAQFNTSVNLTNGQSATVVIDLSAPTYAVSGNVGIQSSFAVKGSTGTSVTINTLSDLLANATNQNLYIGGTGVNGNQVDCSAIAPLSTTTVRVEAFPKSFNSFSNSNSQAG